MVLTETVYKQYSLNITESKMNFHFAFQTFAALSITVRYNVSKDSYQDFFVFQGNESQAHFYRTDNVLKLYLNHMDSFSSYKLDNISSDFWFSWPELTINNIKMLVVHKGETKNVRFDNFTFISPILDTYESCEMQPLIKELTDINYGYIVLMMVVVVILLKADVQSLTELLDRIKVRFRIENEYVSMNNLNTSNLTSTPSNEP